MSGDEQGITLKQVFQLICQEHPLWREYQDLLANPELEVARQLKSQRNIEAWKHRGVRRLPGIPRRYDDLLERENTLERELRDFFRTSLIRGAFVATGFIDRVDASSKVDIRPEAWKHALGSLVGDDVQFGRSSEKKKYFDIRLKRRDVPGHGGGPRGTEARSVEKQAQIWLRENAGTYERGQKLRVLADLLERFPNLSGRATQRIWDSVAEDHGWTRGGRPKA